MFLSYAENINPFGATKKFRCLDSPFHYLIEAFCLLSSPTWAAYFPRQFCGPLLPPAQECNSLQRISFTHHHSQYLPPFLLIYPLVNLPIPKTFRIQVPASQIGIPLTDTARLCVSVPSSSTRSPPSSVFFSSLPMECLLRSNTVVLSPTLEPLPRDLANPTHHSSLIHTILGACALDIPSPRSLCNLFQPPAP